MIGQTANFLRLRCAGAPARRNLFSALDYEKVTGAAPRFAAVNPAWLS